MKIGICHNLYGRYSRGGAETAVTLMVAELKKSGQEVFLVTTKPYFAPPENTGSADLKIYYLHSLFYNLTALPLIFRPFWHLANIFSVRKYGQFKKILQQEKPDLVITHNLMGLGFLLPRALRRLRIRQEHWLHDLQLLHPSGLLLWGQENKLNRWPALIYQALTRQLSGSPEQVISPSAWLLNLHRTRDFFKDSRPLVRPFVWPESKLKKIPAASGCKNFLFIGQIEEQKGVFLLLAAFKKLLSGDIRLILAIRGGGQKITAAKKMAAGDKRIEFLGPLSYEETEQIKARSDCLIVPSLCYENSPTAIYGAHAMGLKVIAAASGGIPEMMKAGDKLFQPGDGDDLVKKIQETIDNIG